MRYNGTATEQIKNQTANPVIFKWEKFQPKLSPLGTDNNPFFRLISTGNLTLVITSKYQAGRSRINSGFEHQSSIVNSLRLVRMINYETIFLFDHLV